MLQPVTFMLRRQFGRSVLSSALAAAGMLRPPPWDATPPVALAAPSLPATPSPAPGLIPNAAGYVPLDAAALAAAEATATGAPRVPDTSLMPAAWAAGLRP